MSIGRKGPKVVLREVVDADLPTLFEQQADPMAVEMAAFTASDPSDRDAFMAHWARILADPEIKCHAIEADGRLAGHLATFERWGKREITYWIDRLFWGKGIATAAVEALLELDTSRPLYARAAADNLASLRVLEKCGFLPESRGRGFAEARGEKIVEILLVLAR